MIAQYPVPESPARVGFGDEHGRWVGGAISATIPSDMVERFDSRSTNPLDAARRAFRIGTWAPTNASRRPRIALHEAGRNRTLEIRNLTP